jgi:hypothetical protein
MNMTQKTVAVLGTYDPLNYSLHELEFARIVGAEIAQFGGILISDTQTGFSSWAGGGGVESQGTVIGFSPASNKYEHEQHYRLPVEHVSTVVYTGFGYLGRDLLMVRSSDIIVVFLGSEKIGHEGRLAKELQKPLLIVSFNKNQEEIEHLLGDLVEYAEIYNSQKDIISRLQHLLAS